MGNKFLPALFFLLFIIAIKNTGWCQNNPLDKKISINVTGQSVENTLAVISSTGNINFSYNSDIIPLDSIVTVKAEQKEIYKILNQMLPENNVYKTTGQHIIILKKKHGPANSNSEKKAKISIKGTVYDAATGAIIPKTSVYIIGGKEGVLTDANGFFSLNVIPDNEIVSIGINKQKYKDTIIFIKAQSRESFKVLLKPKFKTIEPIQQKELPVIPTDHVEQSSMVSRLVKSDMIVHANNIDYYKQRLAQVSFLPFLGSNLKLSGSIVNKFSLNILSGYAYGVNGLEVGGFLNIVRNSMSGVQIGGFGNVTGKNSKGVQIAGFFNHNFGKFDGLQVAGFHNLALDTIDGVQVAGFANILKGKIHGAQVAGFANITTKENDAHQVSGFLNLALKDCKGLQVAGFANHTHGNQGGIQISGFSNTVKGNLKGSQVAGFMNITTKNIKGVQASGFLNYAKKVTGVQLGVINIADTVSVVSIGIFNFVKKGLHQFTLNTDETGSVNFNYSFGTYRFYTIFGITALPLSNPKAGGIVFGFGSQFFAPKSFNINVNLTVASLNIGTYWQMDQNQLYKIATDLNLRLSKRFTLFAGPSFNIFRYNNTDTELTNYPKTYVFPVSQLLDDNGSTYNSWFGVSLGLKYQF